MTDNDRDTLIQNAVMRSLALRDIVAVLLAMQATAHPEPENFFRTISDSLDERLAGMKTTDQQVGMVEEIRFEMDWVLNMARRLSSIGPG